MADRGQLSESGSLRQGIVWQSAVIGPTRRGLGPTLVANVKTVMMFIMAVLGIIVGRPTVCSSGPNLAHCITHLAWGSAVLGSQRPPCRRVQPCQLPFVAFSLTI